MRCAILYMLYPDDYEPMISENDRNKIVNYYRKELGVELPKEIDRALFQIRQEIQKNHKIE